MTTLPLALAHSADLFAEYQNLPQPYLYQVARNHQTHQYNRVTLHFAQTWDGAEQTHLGGLRDLCVWADSFGEIVRGASGDRIVANIDLAGTPVFLTLHHGRQARDELWHRFNVRFVEMSEFHPSYLLTLLGARVRT